MPSDRLWCVASVSMIFGIRTVAIFGKVVVAVDRYISITNALNYRAESRKNTVGRIYVYIWKLNII